MIRGHRSRGGLPLSQDGMIPMAASVTISSHDKKTLALIGRPTHRTFVTVKEPGRNFLCALTLSDPNPN
jgi:hypothetical protein